MASPTLYYVRHGQTDWNAEMRFQGQRDIPLNEKGRAQALHYGEVLKTHLNGVDDIQFISSPLGRTCETMEIIRGALQLDEKDYALDDRLIEKSYGDFEGITKQELKAANRELFYHRKENAWTFCPCNGESHADTIPRISDWYSSLKDDGTYVVTAHGAIGRVLRYLLLNLDESEAAQFPFPQDKVFMFKDGLETRI